jgi:twinkle protein
MNLWNNYNIFFNTEDPNIKEYLTHCPKCEVKANTLYVNTAKESWFCKHCGFAGDLMTGAKTPPPRFATPWQENPALINFSLNYEPNHNIVKSFAKMKITEPTLRHFNISVSDAYFPEKREYNTSIVYPYTSGKNVLNLIYQFAKYRASEFAGVPFCFNYNGIDDDNTFIVLDEIEVLTFYEAGNTNAISIYGGQQFSKETGKNSSKKTNTSVDTNSEKIINHRLEFLTNIEERLKKVKKITIAMPSTPLGEQIKQELLRRLGKEKCWIISPPEADYTWNQFFISYGKERFNILLGNSKVIPVRGIFEVDDIEDDLDNLYYNGLTKGASTGFPSIDPYYTVVPGQWTVVTGIPSHGKSNFLDAVLVNLAKLHDWRFGLFSPENQPVARHYASIMEKFYGQSFEKDKNNRISEEQKEEGKLWLKKHFSVILPHEDDSSTIDGILSLAKILVFRKGIKGLVLDPWNEIDHSRPPGMTETEYISLVLTKIRQFARNFSVHVWLVAHPAKLYKDKETGKYPVPTPYDISGSAHYRNKADNAIAVHRNVGGCDQDVSDIHIQKVRFKEVGRVGMASLRYDLINGKFIDDIDQEKRALALTQKEPTPTNQLIRNFYS